MIEDYSSSNIEYVSIRNPKYKKIMEEFIDRQNEIYNEALCLENKSKADQIPASVCTNADNELIWVSIDLPPSDYPVVRRERIYRTLPNQDLIDLAAYEAMI